MKKEIVYSIRMSILVREALKRAAKKERRTVASLLDKIILDYLEEQRYLLPSETGSDRRSYERKKITLPATTFIELDGKVDIFPCVITDIAAGGGFVTYPRGSRVKQCFANDINRFILSFRLPQTGEELKFTCNTRRMAEVDGEFQVGAVITEPDEAALKKLKNYLI